MDGTELLKENNLYEPGFKHFYEIMYSAKEDIEYIKNFILKVDGPILELGCGMGRVILALAKEFSNEVFVGLDLLKHNIQVCLNKACRDTKLAKSLESSRLRFVEGDMCRFDEYFSSSDTFSLIILCNSTLFHCKTLEAVESLFGSIAKRLSPKGIFFLEYTLTFSETWDWEEKKIADPEYKLFRKSVFYRETNTAKRFFRFQKRENPEEIKEFHVTAHLIEYRELQNIIHSHGLTIVKEEQNFPGEPAGRRKILFIGKHGLNDDLSITR